MNRGSSAIFLPAIDKHHLLNNSRQPSPDPAIRVEKVIRSKRRTIALEITHDATLIVRAPNRAPDKAIADLIREKRGWILRHLEGMRRRPRPAVHEYLEGEIFLFLGGLYPLTFVDDGRNVISRLDRLYVSRSLLPDIRRSLERWYMREAELIVKERCAYFSMVTGLVPASVRVTGARRRWGSCTSEGNVNFSWRLVQAPPGIVDYVVVHELAHLSHHNHSQSFWHKVSGILPDYRERRAWLKENEHLMRI